MDTHVAEPTLDETENFQARLPGEPVPSHDGAEETQLSAGERPSFPPAPGGRNKSRLLTGGAIIGLVAVSSGVILLHHHKQSVPVHLSPQVSSQALPQTSGKAASLPPSQPPTHPNVVAPSAALATTKPPMPPGTVVQPAFQPPPSQSEVAELEAFQTSTAGQSPPAQVPAPATKPRQVATQAVMAPPGYRPNEPGLVPQTAAPPAPLSPGNKPSNAAQPAAIVPVKVNAPGAPTSQPITPTVQPAAVTPANALGIAAKIQAAPLSDAQQVQVLELVTQLATLIRDERTQIENLQADQQSGSQATAAKLSDFERRLALVEAGQALAAAGSVPSAQTTATPSGQPAAPTLVALNTARAALSAASTPTPAPSAPAQVPPPPVQPVTPAQYHVQAASPGLAMLAEVDRSGGDGSEIQVQVGDTIPGYGRVLSVSQKGDNWVVQTQNGLIQ